MPRIKLTNPAEETEPRIQLQILYNLLRHVNDEEDKSRPFWPRTHEQRIRYIKHLAKVYVKKSGGIVE